MENLLNDVLGKAKFPVNKVCSVYVPWNHFSIQLTTLANGYNEVGERDLAFWIPRTSPYITGDMPKVSTFKELVKLPVAQIGCIPTIILNQEGDYIIKTCKQIVVTG